MASASRTTKSFKVVCPYCGDAEAPVRISLNDLQTIACGSCDEEFTAKDAIAKVTEQLRRWEAVARWVEMAGEALSGETEED